MLIPLAFIFIAFGLAGAMVYRKQKNDQIRAGMMEKLASNLDLSYSTVDSFGLSKQLQGFELFERERSRWFRKGKITHVMRGIIDETDVYLFDYTYVIHTGKSQKTVTQTVFFANDKNWFLPNFHLKPERWWHKLKTKLGLDRDINFEETPEFSEKFWLKGDFEELIRQQFTPELRGFLSEKPPAQLEGSNYYLIGYKPGKKLDAEDAKVFFRHCCEVVKMLQVKGSLELLDLVELKKEGILVSSEK